MLNVISDNSVNRKQKRRNFDTELNKRVAKAIRRHCMREGLSYVDFARAVGVHPQNIMQYLYGLNNPSVTVFLRILRLCNMNSTEFEKL